MTCNTCSSMPIIPAQVITVDTRTLAGLKKAEWYHARGYKMLYTGWSTITFEKPRKPAKA